VNLSSIDRVATIPRLLSSTDPHRKLHNEALFAYPEKFNPITTARD
jgi:hypothetical protein